MGMVKVTFSLDQATVAALRRTAERLGWPQSQVIREAVAEYAARADRVSERERLRTLGILNTLRKAPASRTAAAVDTELRAIRSARRSGGRRSGR
jgi:predicted transcriptional regulator